MLGIKRNNDVTFLASWLDFTASNDDSKENLQKIKPKGFIKRNNNFARASRFLVHVFSVTARLRRESAFHVLRRTQTKHDEFFFLLKLKCDPQEIMCFRCRRRRLC